MYKRVASLILLLAMLTMAVVFPAAADDDTITVTGTIFLSTLDMSASSWYATAETQAFLAVLVPFELDEYPAIYDTVLDAIASGSVYISREDSQLWLYYFGQEQAAFVCYMPEIDSLVAVEVDVAMPSSLLSGTVMSQLKSDGTVNDYAAVSSSNILNALQLVLDTLEN